MTLARSLLGTGFAALLAGACAPGKSRAPEAPSAAAPSELFVFAEGPCPKLSVQAAGTRRFLVYGDHGRVLAGWLPGDRLATAESLVELRGGRAFRRASLLDGLPTDARGYVQGELELGGTAEEPWLVRTTVRYSVVKRGPLFERTPVGYRFERGWRPTDEPVTIPRSARDLPEFPDRELCSEDLAFVPLTWTATPEGGLVVAGRCDDEGPANYGVTNLVVAHGAPGAKRWRATLVPGGETLSGIVNLSLAAASEREIYVTAYEPFKEPSERKAYVARFDGKTWARDERPISDGLMSVATDGKGTVWLAGGRALYRSTGEVLEKVSLPQVERAARAGPVHVHTVHYLGGELWVEASYQVKLPGQRGSHWASALFSTRRPDRPLYCDARENADAALHEAEP
ncbi:MAG: hypothetical protein HYZ29_08670 [Myxococcales bacterium]|nr:hypothetical protein [Myxococcales bacterium]